MSTTTSGSTGGRTTTDRPTTGSRTTNTDSATTATTGSTNSATTGSTNNSSSTNAVTRDSATTRPSAARDRLLATASEIFYRDGIHSVGVDRIIDAAGITRATFYRHFPGKEDLVRAYLEAEDASLRAQFAAAADLGLSPDELLEAIIGAIADDVSLHHTRGCPFINASAEYPDATSPVRRTVKSHRDWFRQQLFDALSAAGRDNAAERAGALVLLRDAALVGGYLDGPDTIRATFIDTARTVAGLG